MSIVLQIIVIFITYLWGSIPYGYLIAKKYHGINIREFGSGNVGSTNVGRVVGRKMAIVTQLLDMMKGLLPVAVLLLIKGQCSIPENFIYFVAIATILGHNFSVFLKFNGGKGVNTTLGASLLLAPQSVLISVVFYYLVKWRFKYVSLGSIVIGISLPLMEFLFHGIGPTFYYLLVCFAFILFMHRSNIKRLIYKTELKA